MSHGIIHTRKHGDVHGVKHFVHPYAPSGTTFSSDSLSGRPVPANASEWAAFNTSNSLTTAAPNYLHLLQEPSGALADSIGTLTLTNIATVAGNYSAIVPGWMRRGIKGDAATANQRFVNTAGPNPSLTSVAAFFWIYLVGVDASVRPIFASGTAASNWGLSSLETTLVDQFRVRGPGGIGDTPTTSLYTSVHPVLIVNDITGGRLRFYSDLEKLSPAYALPASATNYGFGAIGSGTMSAATVLYSCGWTGANAEAFSDANAKKLIEAMRGATVPWS